MSSFGVGNHFGIKKFDCLDCALRYYETLEGKKYLSKLGLSDKPKEIIKNTYGWENGK